MPTPRQRRKQPPVNVNELQHGQFPGDTVVVQDPPPSNMATQDSYGDEKGIKAPPGARGEYTERPKGNYGGSGGSIGVDPMKYKVDYSDEAKRNQIPPMFLPAAAKEEIDNEDEPADEEKDTRTRDFERGLLQPQPSQVAPLHPTPTALAPTPPPIGTGLEFKDFFSKVTKGEFGMSDVAWEPILPLEGLEPFLDSYVKASGNFAAHIAKSIPAFQEVQLKTGNALVQTLPPGSRVLDIGASEGNWGKAVSASSRGQIATVSLDPNPDMKNTFDTRSPTPGATYEMKSFETGFDDPALGRVEALPARGEFDVVHEAMVFQFISPNRANQIAEMKRHLKPGGVAMVEEKVFNDAWQQNERKKDTEYKSRYFAPAALQEKDKMVGFQQSKGESGTVGMLDNMVPQQVLEEALAANFAHVIQYWDSGNFKGYAASDDLNKLRSIVGAMHSTKTPFSTVETPRMVTSGAPRRAFTVYPVPTRPRPPMDERLLLQIPHDAQERYNDLHRRVSEYVKNLKLNTLDMYSFPSDPPEKWVEEERGNVQVDWEDHDAWSAYMGRLSHDDVADWVGLESFDDERLTGLAPGLHAQHALETGGTQDFNSWFRSRRPAIEDREFLNYVQNSARTFPAHGLGKGYSGYWRRRNHEQVREIATSRAKERHDRYLREVDYHNHVKPNYRKSFDAIVQSRQAHMPLSDVVNSLHALPVEGADRESVDGFQDELDGIVNEGVHALDLYREPISRDDRLHGDMEYQGEKWVSVRKIAGEVGGVEFPKDHPIGMRVPKGGSACSKCYFVSEDKTECGEKHFVKWNEGHKLPAPADEYCCDFFKEKGQMVNAVVVPLYQYGDRYFLVHETDRQHISDEMLMVRAQVYAITPGSSIVKRADVHWSQKSRALSAAINEIKGGADREATFIKYAREFGPGIRKAIHDYLFVTSARKGDGGGGPPGSSFGDSTCSSFEQQSPDNCSGCTFAPNMGGYEFGYGDNGCLLSDLFLNAPEAGFGRGDTRPSNPDRAIGTPGTQPRKPRA